MRIVIAACILLISVIKVTHADVIRIAAADDPIARVVARIATEVYRQVGHDAEVNCQRRGKNTPFAGAIIHHCGGVKVHQLLQSNTRCYGLSR